MNRLIVPNRHHSLIYDYGDGMSAVFDAANWTDQFCGEARMAAKIGLGTMFTVYSPLMGLSYPTICFALNRSAEALGEFDK